MTGIVNSTGARSGVIGTTVGTPSGGKVLQVINQVFDGTSSLTVSLSDQVVNSMSRIITPLGTASDFLVTARWAGETGGSWDKVWNIQMDGTRVNAPSSGGYGVGKRGLAVSPVTYWGDDNDSTPDGFTLTTLVSTSSVIGTDITFRLVTSGGGSVTWSNRCFTETNEVFTSELIIIEIAG